MIVMATKRINGFIITIEKVYCDLIKANCKIAELRTRIPLDLSSGDVIYVSEKGSHGRITLKIEVGHIESRSPGDMFDRYRTELCINAAEYFNYVGHRKVVYAIFFARVQTLDCHVNDFGLDRAPQWFARLK